MIPLSHARVRAERVARQRLPLVRLYLKHRAQGRTRPEAATLVGLATATAWRLADRYLKDGVEGLLDGRYRSGHRQFIGEPGITEEVLRVVEEEAVRLRSNKRAWLSFAESPLCPPRIRARLQGGRKIPGSLFRATAIKPVKLTAYRGRSGRVFARIRGRLVMLDAGSKQEHTQEPRES